MNNPFIIGKREVAEELNRFPQTIYNWINLAIEHIDDFAGAIIYQSQNHRGKLNAYQFWVLRAISNIQARGRNPTKDLSKVAIAKYLAKNDFSLKNYLKTIPTIETNEN